MPHKSNLSTNQRRGTDIRYVRNEAPHTCDQFTTICYRVEWLITQLGPCSRSAPHVSVAMISTISCNDPPISYCVSGYTSWFHVIVIISRLIVNWWTLLWSEFYCMVHICPNYVLMSDVLHIIYTLLKPKSWMLTIVSLLLLCTEHKLTNSSIITCHRHQKNAQGRIRAPTSRQANSSQPFTP